VTKRGRQLHQRVSININAAGLRQEQNGYEIDGAQTNTPSRGGGTSISPNPEIVQSMEVMTNDFDAQKGRNGGATVDVFTLSGSNQFHGNIDWEFTNNDLSALTHFESKLPELQAQRYERDHGGTAFTEQAILVWRDRSASLQRYQCRLDYGRDPGSL
jgi:hypothetical protein